MEVSANGGIPIAGWLIMENPEIKWMIEDTPILRDHHILHVYVCMCVYIYIYCPYLLYIYILYIYIYIYLRCIYIYIYSGLPSVYINYSQSQRYCKCVNDLREGNCIRQPIYGLYPPFMAKP